MATSLANWKRNVALFMGGQAITMFGSSLVQYALMWHIVLETQSGFMMTLVIAAGTIPMLLITPFAGVWADRFNKKLLINISDAAIAVATLAMFLLLSAGVEWIGLLLILMMVRGFGQGIQEPTNHSVIPEIVPHEHLTRVNGFQGSIRYIAMFASPMLGGALLAIAPIQILLFIDVITAAIGISILFFFVKVPSPAKKEHKLSAKQHFVEIGEGFRYIGTQLYLKKAMMITAFINILLSPALILTPLLVARVWGDDTTRLFDLFSLTAEHRLAALSVLMSFGMIFGGLIIGWWGGFKNKNHTFSLCTALLGVGVVSLGFVGNFWLFLLCMGIVGIFMSMRSAPAMAMLQSNVEPANMGRFFSALQMMGSIAMPIGMFIWGPLGDVVDIEWLLIGTGAFIVLLGIVCMFDKTMLTAGLTKETSIT